MCNHRTVPLQYLNVETVHTYTIIHVCASFSNTKQGHLIKADSERIKTLSCPGQDFNPQPVFHPDILARGGGGKMVHAINDVSCGHAKYGCS